MDDVTHQVGPHVPIMVLEVLRHLRPAPGEVAVDCTLGGGGHAWFLLQALQPFGRLVALDLDSVELPRTEARLRAAGFGPDTLVVRHGSFADLRRILAAEGLAAADMVLVDLGVSAMQHDTPSRGFSYKHPGPLDLRLDPADGRPAADLLADLDAPSLERVLREYADEPHAARIAALVAGQGIRTTHALERVVRLGLAAAVPTLSKADVKMSVRRTFQALRILVNDELGALDALLRDLPHVLAPGGRVVVLTFHSGEDRRVKHAFRAGERDGTYAAVARQVVRSGKAETFANRRAASAKLRWAIRAGP